MTLCTRPEPYLFLAKLTPIAIAGLQAGEACSTVQSMRFIFVFYFLIFTQAVAELKQPEILTTSSASVKVPVNGSVIVTLTLQDQRKNHSFSFSKKDFNFAITVPPKYGTLSPLQQSPRQTHVDQATVVYTHSGEMSSLTDTFVFEARSENSAVQGVAKIQILHPQIRVEPAGELNFGSVIAEQSTSRNIYLHNTGEIPVTGAATLTSPFSLLEANYSLAPNERKKIIIQCQPQKAGAYQTRLQFSSHPQLVYQIQATALSPLAFFPETLDLGTQAQHESFTEKIKLFNRGKKSQHVSLKIDAPFYVEKKVFLLAGESSAEFIVQAAPSTNGLFQSKIIAQAGLHLATAQVQLKSLRDARLEMISPKNLGKLELNQKSLTNSVVVVNRGEVTWQGEASVRAPFSLVSNSFVIGASETQRLTIIFRPTQNKKFQENLVWTEAKTGRTQSFSLSAESFTTQKTRTVSSNSFVSVSMPSYRKNKMPSWPTLAVTGLYHKMFEAEKALIKWKSSEDPASFRLYQKQWQWNADRSRVIEQWQWVEDVSCQRFDAASLGFLVDRLRPQWHYTFSIREVDPEGNILAASEPFFIQTPSASKQPLSYKIWIILGAVTLAILGFWFLKNINRWFGGALGG
jgi:hypothetical protein